MQANFIVPQVTRLRRHLKLHTEKAAPKKEEKDIEIVIISQIITSSFIFLNVIFMYSNFQDDTAKELVVNKLQNKYGDLTTFRKGDMFIFSAAQQVEIDRMMKYLSLIHI